MSAATRSARFHAEIDRLRLSRQRRTPCPHPQIVVGPDDPEGRALFEKRRYCAWCGKWYVLSPDAQINSAPTSDPAPRDEPPQDELW